MKKIFLLVQIFICSFSSPMTFAAEFEAAWSAEKQQALDAFLHAATERVAEKFPLSYSKEAYAELRNFLNTTPHPDYGSLPLGLFSYEWTTQSWSFEYLSQESSFTRGYQDRADIILHYLNLFMKESGFERALDPTKSFSLAALLTEPGVHIKDRDSHEAELASQELAAILSRCPVLAPCAIENLAWTKRFILIPDFYMLTSQYENCDDILTYDMPPFLVRRNQCFFSGAPSGPEHPFMLSNIAKNPRLHLLDYTQSKKKSHDFLKIVINNSYILTLASKDASLLEWFHNNHNDLVGPQRNFRDHASYKYLLSFDGFGAAWARVPNILATGSVLLMHTLCDQWFYTQLRPYDTLSPNMVNDENYIALSEDLSNLEEVYTWLETHPEQAEKIGRNGRNFVSVYLSETARYLFFLNTIYELQQRFTQG